MSGYDLWADAGDDHEAMIREGALVRAETEFGDVFPFLAMAASEPEFGHRMAIAADRLEMIAASSGVSVQDVEDLARRRWTIMREALAEGQDPLIPVATAADGSFGSGAANAYQHDESVDMSGDYAEIPWGGSGGPDPQVVMPRPPQSGPVQEATGSLRRQGDSNPGGMMTAPYTSPMAPDTGTGSGSVDSALPASGGMTPSLPAGVGDPSANQPLTPQSIGQVSSSKDPVRRQVMAVTAAIAASNPHMPRSEHERVARVVVGRYLRHADLDSSVMDNDPGDDSGSQGGGGGGHHGMSGLEEYGLGRALISAAPEMLAAL